MNELFIVVELQKEGDVLSAIVTDFEELRQAFNKFYNIAAAASISSVDKHSAIILDINGGVINQVYFENGEISEYEAPKYLMIEFQANADGANGNIITTYDDIDAAKTAFNNTAAYAAISSVKSHSIYLLSEDGGLIKSINFEH